VQCLVDYQDGIVEYSHLFECIHGDLRGLGITLRRADINADVTDLCQRGFRVFRAEASQICISLSEIWQAVLSDGLLALPMITGRTLQATWIFLTLSN